MGTIAEKLNYTLGAKSSIKNSIINKGVAMPDATPLGEYGSYIDSIQTGGGGGDTPGGGGGGDTPGGGGSQVSSCGISANVVNLLDLYTLSNNDLSIKCSILDTYYSEKVDICDNVPRQVYTSGTTVYCNHSSYPTRKSFVVPIQPGRTYIVKSNAVGNKESITLCSNNPLEVTYYTAFYGTRNLRDVNSTPVGFETIFTAADNENYLVIYYTTNDEEANYSVYTYQRRQ